MKKARTLAPVAVPTVMAAVICLVSTHGRLTGPGAWLMAGIGTAITCACTLLYRWCTPRVGALTAWAVLVLLAAAVFAAVFAVSPNCYTGAQARTCTATEVVTWSMVGAMLPAACMVTFWLPWRVLRATPARSGQLVRLFVRLPGMSPLRGPVENLLDRAAATFHTSPTSPQCPEADVSVQAQTRRKARSGNPAVRAEAEAALGQPQAPRPGPTL